MLLGAHVSISQGVDKAIIRGQEIGSDTIQIFTKNSTQWKSKEIKDEELQRYLQLKERSGINPIFSHNSYLINMGSPDHILLKISRNAFIEELRRCETLQLAYLVTHPGAYLNSTLQDGIKRIGESLSIAHQEIGHKRVVICLENTAGQGTSIGHKFEELIKIIELTDHGERLGICLDTCHLFTGGYDIKSINGYKKTFEEFEAIFGIHRLKVIHLNDTKNGLGSRVDRHEHIGKGFLGIKPFQWLLNDKRFNNIPMVIETPKGRDAKVADIANLKLLRSLIKSSLPVL